MMSAHFLLVAALGFGPVLLFLAALLHLDSFKLVSLSTVVGALGLGVMAAVASYLVSGVVMDALQIDFPVYSRFVAPFVEEALKASVMIWLFSRNRIGFVIDAAILGIAVGAGFSMFENIYYAYVFPEANFGVWLVRGLGTAIMHGGVTAIYGITTQTLREHHGQSGVLAYLPGLLIAGSLHSIFNQFTPWPLFQAAGTVVVLPLILFLLFDKSEHEVHNWLIQDYESHERLLADIESGAFTHSVAGRVIQTLAAKFSRETVADIFAYLKLHTELVLRAERILFAKERGESVQIGKSEREKFTRLHALERAIGRTALMAIWPYLKFSRKELFELHLVEKQAAHA